MDIGKAFTFAFDDEDKIKKLLIGAVVMLVPIVNFAGLGYMIRLIRNVQAGVEYPLPDWDEFGDHFVNGLKVLVGILFYSIPLLLLICVFGVVGTGLSNSVNTSDIDDVMGILAACLGCLAMLFGLIPYLFLPALLIRYAETEEISSLIRVGELWSYIQQDVGGYVIVLAIGFVAFNFLAPLGIIACGVGLFLTQWWAYLIFAHLTGQFARNTAMAI